MSTYSKFFLSRWQNLLDKLRDILQTRKALEGFFLGSFKNPVFLYRKLKVFYTSEGGRGNWVFPRVGKQGGRRPTARKPKRFVENIVRERASTKSRRDAATMFCWQCLFAVLFLALVMGSGFSLSSYLSPAALASQEKIDNLFLGKDPESPLISLPLNFVEKNSVKAITVSQIPSTQVLGAIVNPLPEFTEPKERILEYIVEPGDNLSQIAAEFDISVSTLLWANDLSISSTLRPGQKLIILPVSGVLHYVKKGETLSGIAETYGGELGEIIVFNDLSDGGKIYVGDLLIIPGGKMPARRVVSAAPYLPLPDTLFICPISSPCRITQGLHWYNAIDFSNGRCGEAIYAVAGGTVQKTGYHRIAGRYIRLLHPSGIVTFYGHLSKILVSPGQAVSQGQVIGYTGYSGYTVPAGPAGCHVHFEVRGARNPFAK